jgi:TolB-like protein/Flp pilus assembly protein TadD
VGDVVHMGGRVHGDGVNIASRIQSLAEPGGICLSGDVARLIQNKMESRLVRLGRGELKNISLPVDIYAVVMPWDTNLTGWKKRVSHVGSQRRTRRTLLIAAAAIVMVLILLIVRPFGQETFSRTRVAVLPFENIGSDPEAEYFADGMTEEMIATLSTVSSLDVIARTSVMKYKGTLTDIEEIARSLMVGTILEGSVRRSTQKTRINVKLVDVSTQETVWSDEYDRSLHDAFMVQGEIARKVTAMLSVHLGETEASRLERTNSESGPAYEQYFLGNHFLNQRTGAALEQAITHFKRATALDSTFALAYSGLADCFTVMALGFGTRPRAETSRLAAENARKAISIDNDLAEARASLGYIKFRIEWDWEGAEEEFLRAIALKPGYARVHEWYGLYLALLGRHEESLREINRAYALDPKSPSVGTGVGRFLQLAGKVDEAVAQLQKTLEMEPGYAEAHFALGMTYASMGGLAPAEKEILTALELSGGRPIVRTFLGIIHARSGKTEKVKDVLEDLRSTSPGGVIPYYYRSAIEFALGHHDSALELLGRAVDDRDPFVVFLKTDPMFRGLKHDARYHALLVRVGLER